MKLNKFFDNPKKVSRSPTQFVLQNDEAEVRYKSQIDALNTQLGAYRTIEAQRDEATLRLRQEREISKDSRDEATKLEQQLTDSKNLVNHIENQLLRIPDLEEAVNAANGQYSQANNELQNLTTTAFEQSKTISFLGTQVDGLTSDNTNLAATSKQAVADKISAVIEFTTVQKENIQLKNFTDETSKINSNLKRELNDIKGELLFWENESKESIVQLTESRMLEKKLRKWIDQMETKMSHVTSSHVRVDENKKELQETIQEMGSVMEDLIKEMTFLRTLNKEYRKELSKPKFMSMGAIARREGFVMPTGKENLRTHYLGNAVPTLLKFKAKEEISRAR